MKIFSLICFCMFLAACATAPKPLAYLSLKKTPEVISMKKQKSVRREFSRGGWFIGNNGFRPAIDVEKYITELTNETKSYVLKDADVQMNVPFAFAFIFFGYNSGTDVAANNSGIDRN